jgi:hypothetical protein
LLSEAAGGTNNGGTGTSGADDAVTVDALDASDVGVPDIRILQTIEGRLPHIHVNAISQDIDAAGMVPAGAPDDQLIIDFANFLFDEGPEIFEFDAPNDAAALIINFTPTIDEIHVSADNFGGGLAPGALPADRFISGSDPAPVASGVGVFLYDTENGALAWDADGAEANAPVTLAFLINLPALSASDFLIV